MTFISNYIHHRKWNKLNRHNGTHAATRFDISKVSVGKATYGDLHVLTYNDINTLRIGNYCSIGPNVWFIVSADHYVNHLSTYPFRNKIISCGKELEGVSKGDIVVEDDVWFGCNATILSGVHIGQGAIVAAGAVVTADIPPYAIAGGVPARVLSYRFDEETRSALCEFDFSKLSDEDIIQHKDELYKELVLEEYSWFPRRTI